VLPRLMSTGGQPITTNEMSLTDGTAVRDATRCMPMTARFLAFGRPTGATTRAVPHAWGSDVGSVRRRRAVVDVPTEEAPAHA
jgi:hypothetical protein